MFRIDSSSAVSALPIPAAAGTPGFFTGGDPAAGIPPTTVTADFLNMIQEEMVNVVLAAGEVPSKTDHGQLLTALRAMFMPLADAESFGSNANGYWIKHANGVIEQWGHVSVATGANTYTGTFAFPIPFTDLPSVVVTGNLTARPNPSWGNASFMGTASDLNTATYTVDTGNSGQGFGAGFTAGFRAIGR